MRVGGGVQETVGPELELGEEVLLRRIASIDKTIAILQDRKRRLTIELVTLFPPRREP